MPSSSAVSTRRADCRRVERPTSRPQPKAICGTVLASGGNGICGMSCGCGIVLGQMMHEASCKGEGGEGDVGAAARGENRGAADVEVVGAEDAAVGIDDAVGRRV